MCSHNHLNFCRRFAELMHNGQTRSNGAPYIEHPTEVMQIVFDELILTNKDKDDPEYIYDMMAAAVLHDVLEDCNITEEQLAFFVGKRITKLVVELTNKVPNGTPFAEKQAKLVEHCKVMSDDAKLIKLADRLDNLKGAGKDWPEWREKRYAHATTEIVAAMGTIPEHASNLADEVVNVASEILNPKP